MNININIYRRKNEILDNNILLVLCLSFACPGYARKVLEEHKSPKEIAIEEGITEEEVRKALFEEALGLTGNNEAIDTIKSAIAELEQKEM